MILNKGGNFMTGKYGEREMTHTDTEGKNKESAKRCERGEWFGGEQEEGECEEGNLMRLWWGWEVAGLQGEKKEEREERLIEQEGKPGQQEEEEQAIEFTLWHHYQN